MRDKFSGEVAATLKPYGIYRKLQDRGYKVKLDPSAGLGTADVEPGFPDGFFIGSHKGALIEAKTGQGTSRERLPYAAWRPNQVRWYLENCEPRQIPYYLFINMGEAINHAKYPRIALLMPASTFLSFANRNQNRKSLSYDEAKELKSLRLTWAGYGRWLIPDYSRFYQEMRLTNVIIDPTA